MKLLPVPERRVITIEEEMGYFLVKAHSDATANLREITCQLWGDGVDVSPPTRKRSLRVEKPFYSMLTMTTPETLEARLDEDDILTGLLPRFIFFKGTPRQPIAWPVPPNHQSALALAAIFRAIDGHVQTLGTSSQQGRIEPTPSARELWEVHYTKLHQRALDAPTPAIGRMLARIEVHVMKAALFYAISSFHSVIEDTDLQKALALGHYLSKTATEVASTAMGGEIRRLEFKILDILGAKNGQWVKVRSLQQSLSGRVKAQDFLQSLRALIRLGAINCCSVDDERPKWVRIAPQ